MIRVIFVLFLPVDRSVPTEPPLGVFSLAEDQQGTLILTHGLEVFTLPLVFIGAPQEKLRLDF